MSAINEAFNGLPVSWQLAKLGDIAFVQGGFAFKSSDYRKDGIPLLRISNIRNSKISFDEETVCLASDYEEKYKEFLLATDDVVIALSGATTGKFGKYSMPNKALLNQRVGRLRYHSPSLICSSYVYHYLEIVRREILKKAYGAAQPNISPSDLAEFTIPLAPLVEQQRIVAEIEKQLTRLDAAVAALKRVQANLKRYRASVLKAACEGKLVPTEADLARAEGRDYESADKLLERILKERRAKWEADQLAKMKAQGKEPKDDKWKDKYQEPVAPDTRDLSGLPEGWIWAFTQQLGKVQLGRQRSPGNRSKTYPTKYLRAANITEKGLDLSDLLDMEFEPQERERYHLQIGDIVLSEASGSPKQVGKPAMWRGELEGCCFQNTVIRLQPLNLSSQYLLLVFKNYYFNGVFSKIASGVGINHLSADKFSVITVPLPPFAEQQRIVAEVERRLSVVDEIESVVKANLKRAERLRQAILKHAFEGKLVAQDPNDEPASGLLERIRQERASLGAATKPAKPTRKKRSSGTAAST